MYHSKFTANSEFLPRESTASNIPVLSSASNEPMEYRSTELNLQMPEPSAPLLPSSQNNPKFEDIEPPSYNSLLAQDSIDPKYQFSSFPDTIGARSESRLDNPPAYSVDDGPASGPQTTLSPGSIEEPGRLKDLQEVITTQPKTMNMNSLERPDSTSTVDEDREKQRRSNTNANRETNNVECCADWALGCCNPPIVVVDTGHHNSSGCCDDGNDGCCTCCCADCCNDGDSGCDCGDGDCCCDCGGCDCGDCDCGGFDCGDCGGCDCTVS